MGLKRSLSLVLLVTVAPGVTVIAQTIKPPVAAMTQARVAQEYAQQQQARVINFVNEQAIQTSLVQAPQVGSTGGGGNGDVNWLKVEFHYGVNPEHPDKYPWVDSAQFKVWIEGRDLYAPNAPAGGFAICLTGDVTYVNLQQARDAWGVFFVSPSTLARYSGSGRVDDFDRKFNIHIEAYVGGKLVDYFNKNPRDPGGNDWFKAPTAVPNLVCRQDQTPFFMSDVTKYPQIKLPSQGQGQ